MAKYTITPWRSQHDLLEVRSQLYHTSPSTPDQRRHAINRVMAWKLRGNLPHAAESTALLLDAILHHRFDRENSIFSIRAVYSAAFTRFVTGFCDIGRNKERSLEPSSMLEIARQIGMPVEFVALRHEATHEELPAVQRLVKAVDDALQWLWTVYWSRLEEPESEAAVAASLAQVKADARQILRGFRSRRRDALKSRKHRNDVSDVQSTARASVQLFGNNVAKMESFVSVLVEDKLLSPSKRELGASLDGAYVIWDDVLTSVVREQRRFVIVLIQALLESISARLGEDADKEALCLWVVHILHSEAWRPILTSSEKGTLRRDVMMSCCTHPGRWTQRLGDDMLKAEDEEFVEEWQELFEASQLDAAGQAASGGVDVKAPASGLLNDGFTERTGHVSLESDNDAEMGTWVRAAKPFAAPIGVVR